MTSAIWSEVELWEILLFVVLLALAWGGSWMLGRLLRRRMERALQSKAPVVGLEVLRTLVPLLRWGLLLVALAVALEMPRLPAPVELWLGHGLRAALAVLAAWVAGRARTRGTLAPVLARACQVFFYLIAVLLVLQNLGYNVAGLLAGLGIGGLAVALAAKETLANLFGSLALLMDCTFQVGDTIKQGEVEGEVVNIGLRSTRVRTKEGYIVSIPNQLMTNAAVTNMTPPK